MTLREQEFQKLDAMCGRVEFAYSWPKGKLKSKSSAKEVVALRNQIIAEAFDRKFTAKSLSKYFKKTVQSIYDSVEKAKIDAEFRKKRAEIENWLCEV